MNYINEEHLNNIGIDWNETVDVIQDTVECIKDADFSQPIKPYLRYNNLNNRIIAMPAYVGGRVSMSGIKWIASFPENINLGIPRAHSVVILNNAATGKPEAIINTPLLSVIRTASVSGLMIRRFLESRSREKLSLGIIGFGPIGQYHLNMAMGMLGEKLDKVYLYDIKGIDLNALPEAVRNKVTIVNRWEEAYMDADIFITCTVSKAPYINVAPKRGSLHLNVSLRDYSVDTYEYFKGAIIVDDWEEVCRENTDIENMHREKGLVEEDTISLKELISCDKLNDINSESAILFNPMGMASFDIAIGKFFLDRAISSGQLISLN